MSEVEEKLVLRWNEFQVEALDSQREMWKNREFTDVTLATEDDQQISSHRLILSAHSTFFKRILMKNPQQNLVIFLKDICLSELELLLEFVYTGQVQSCENFFIPTQYFYTDISAIPVTFCLHWAGGGG